MTTRLTFEQFLKILPRGGYEIVNREITEDCKEYVYPQLENNHAMVQRTHYLELEHPNEDMPNMFFAVRAHHTKLTNGEFTRSLYEYLQFDTEEEQLMHLHQENLRNPTEMNKFLSN